MLDVVHEGGLRRLAVKASGPDAAELEPRIRTRPLPVADEPGLGAAVRSGTPQLLQAFPEDVLRAMAQGEDDLALLRVMRMCAGIVIPPSARGRTLGALTLLATDYSRRSYTAEESAVDNGNREDTDSLPMTSSVA